MQNGFASYEAGREGEDALSEEGTFTPEQLGKIKNLISNNHFFSLIDKPYTKGDSLDGSEYIITIKTTISSEQRLPDVSVTSVSCYEFNCEQKFIDIKNTIIQFWGKEFLEVGV